MNNVTDVGLPSYVMCLFIFHDMNNICTRQQEAVWRYKYPHWKPKTDARPFYVYNGNPYTSKVVSSLKKGSDDMK